MVTHDVDEALYLADRLILMTDGPEATIGEILDVPFPPAAQAGCRAAGCALTSVRTDGPAGAREQDPSPRGSLRQRDARQRQ
jgi:ABC-type taurine transport system ATPase subunit